MYICIYIYICIYPYMYAYMYTCTCIYVYMYACMYVNLFFLSTPTPSIPTFNKYVYVHVRACVF